MFLSSYKNTVLNQSACVFALSYVLKHIIITFILSCILLVGGEAKSCIEYVKVGCYKDSLREPRPLPMLIESNRPGLNWSFPEHLINK